MRMVAYKKITVRGREPGVRLTFSMCTNGCPVRSTTHRYMNEVPSYWRPGNELFNCNICNVGTLTITDARVV